MNFSNTTNHEVSVIVVNINTISLLGLLGSIFIKDRTIFTLDLSHINSMCVHKTPLTNLSECDEISGL
jgi:hypothetical protein